MLQRNHTVDTMRGIAITMMFMFHFIFDLNYFEFTNINIFTDNIYILWRYLIASLFLITVGISMVYAYKDNFVFKKFIWRLMILAAAAIAVSVGSYLIFPHSWIYFGILHLIWISSIIAIFLLKLPKLSLAIAILIFALQLINQPNISFFYDFLDNFLPKYSVDFYPLFPWLALVLIGIFLAHCKYFNNININIKIFSLLGRHSLILYLSHQIVLFSIVGLVYYIINLGS